MNNPHSAPGSALRIPNRMDVFEDAGVPRRAATVTVEMAKTSGARDAQQKKSN